MTGVSQRWALAALAWALVILILGLVPLQPVLDATAGPSHEGQATVAGHFVEYALLAVLVLLAAGGGRGGRRGYVLAFALAALLGALIEGVQGLLPWRDSQLIDVIVNTLGAACGLGGFALVNRLRGRRLAREVATGRRS